MPSESARTRAMDDTRVRILDGALEILGRTPDAGMGEIASAVGVVRRTLYGYFPTRADLVTTLAQRAVDELAAILDEIDITAGSAAGDTGPDTDWVEFVAQLWPLAHRYRVLVTLRRGEQGLEIHALLEPVDRRLAALVTRGQDAGVFGQHLPASILAPIAFSAVFSIADSSLADGAVEDVGEGGAGEDVGLDAATVTSLLILGVASTRAEELVSARG